MKILAERDFQLIIAWARTWKRTPFGIIMHDNCYDAPENRIYKFPGSLYLMKALLGMCKDLVHFFHCNNLFTKSFERSTTTTTLNSNWRVRQAKRWMELNESKFRVARIRIQPCLETLYFWEVTWNHRRRNVCVWLSRSNEEIFYKVKCEKSFTSPSRWANKCELERWSWHFTRKLE